MALTPAQSAALKAAILADPALSSQPNNSDGAFAIAAALNQVASPQWVVWKTNVSTAEIMNNGFLWSAVDGLAAGKARIWDWMTRLGEINPSKANIRQGLADCFGANSAMATAILPHLKQDATRAQKLFSSGTGTTATPATLDANISQDFALAYQDVETARNS